jgi:hypothetical protein
VHGYVVQDFLQSWQKGVRFLDGEEPLEGGFHAGDRA